MDMSNASEPARLWLNRAERLGVAALAALLLAACIALVARSAGQRALEPPQAAQDAPYRVDLNRAPWFELSLVPGLGEVLSKRIVDYRRDPKHGPFKSVDELEAIEGIGKIKLEQLRPYLVLNDE